MDNITDITEMVVKYPKIHKNGGQMTLARMRLAVTFLFLYLWAGHIIYYRLI
jgi:hypothetical protein